MRIGRLFRSTALFCAVATLGSIPAIQAAESEPARAKTISLNSYVLDVTRPASVPAHLTARAASSGAGEYTLVKFGGPVTAAQLDALKASGAKVYTYLPYDTFLVKMPAGKTAKSLLSAKSAGAVWTGPYHPAYKISKYVAAIAAETAKEAAAKPAHYQSVMVDVFPDADLGAVVQQIKDLGIQGVVGSKKGDLFSRVRILLSPGEIARFREGLAQIADVFWLDLEPRRELLNDTTIWVGQSGLSAGQTTPVFSHGIYGEGQVVGIIDTGIDPDMCFFRDTSLGLPTTNACNGGTAINSSQRKILAVDFLTSSECSGGISATEWDTQGHGTHVAGTVAGDNFANLLTHNTADGMAPGAKLVIQDAGYLTDNCGDLPGIGCPVVDLKPIFLQAYTQGARMHTNSWGDNENGAVQNNYTAASQDVDQFMWDHKDFQVFFAAGNAGPGTGSVGSPSTSKSGVSVGATLRGTSAQSMASFSSCGPTDDGRIKPDITVPGSSIVSAGNDGNSGTNNCGTATLSGTSMASPGAAGLTALIRQYYVDGWYPSGLKTPADSLTPSAALMRATLVNSAENMTGATAIPSNCQGWGRVTLDDALYFSPETKKLAIVDDTSGFASGSVNVDKVYSYTVNTSGQPFKITLSWTDYPSTPAANPHINNDLDLIVTGPSGTFKGNVFSGGVSATGGSADRKNTLEQVLLASPTPGTYTVTVRAINVPNGPQPFALVVTGDVGAAGPCTPPAAAPTGVSATGTGQTTATVSWTAAAGASEYHILRSTTSGSGYVQVGTATGTSFNDTGLTCNTVYYYVVRAANSATCETGNSAQASATTAACPTCTNTTLYTNGFETGTGLATWTKGTFVSGGSTTSWRGIQTCTAQTGTKIFRYGGTGCTSAYSNNNFTYARVNGTAGVVFGANANTSRLTFGHRWGFESGFDGGTLFLTIDGTNYFQVPASAILSGTTYNGTVAASCAPAGAAGAPIFTGTQSSFVNTTVDLDAACNAAGSTTGCKGKTVGIAFTAITDCSTTSSGWFLDNVTVTDCQ